MVLYTNDVHCGVDAGTPEDTMGYANLAAYKHAMEEAHEHVVLVDAGDAIQGEAIGTLSNGSYLVDIMNQVGYDYATFGNHEFDYGMDVALSPVGEVQRQVPVLQLHRFEDKQGCDRCLRHGDLRQPEGCVRGRQHPGNLHQIHPHHFQDENGNYIYSFCRGQRRPGPVQCSSGRH